MRDPQRVTWKEMMNSAASRNGASSSAWQAHHSSWVGGPRERWSCDRGGLEAAWGCEGRMLGTEGYGL